MNKKNKEIFTKNEVQKEILKVATNIIKKHIKAFKELAK